MIVDMLKYTFLVYHKNYPDFIKKLKSEGVLHVVEKNEITEDIRNEISKVKEIEDTINILEKRIAANNIKNVGTAEPIRGEDLVKLIHGTVETLDHNAQKVELLNKEIQSLAPWGSYSTETIKKLSEQNIKLSFFICATSSFKQEWNKDFNIEIVNTVASQIYFVVIHRENDLIDLDADFFKFPNYHCSSLEKKLKELSKEEEVLNSKLDLLCVHSQTLLTYKANVLSGIGESKILLNTEDEADNKVKVLEGWVPKPKSEELNVVLDKEDIYYYSNVPNKKDIIPVKLKNNKFSKLFEPIGELYTLPKYGEMDLTPFFAPFYFLFFGFCLGDAGYGLLFLLGATFYKRKADKKIKSLITLVQILGVSTVAFGILTGTFFGINLAESSFESLQAVKQYFLTPENMFQLALIFGVIQILFGMVLNIVNITRQEGFRYALSKVGWLTLFIAAIVSMGLQKLDMITEDVASSILYVAGAFSAVLILLLNNPKKNVFVNFGGGLWDVYNMVTGMLGDVLSYIRLFALGLSSSILGFVFNDLAVQLSGDTPFVSQFFFLLILLIGHGINIFMAGLGSFVHPLRLTFVEFYKNSGFMGGGKAYTPFK